MEITQIILAIAVLILTGILALVGYEVFLIFREVHKAVRRVNQLLDDAASVTGTISHQLTNVAELLGTVKKTFDLAKVFFKKGDNKESGEGEEIEGEEGLQLGAPKNGHRFFTRAGKKLPELS